MNQRSGVWLQAFPLLLSLFFFFKFCHRLYLRDQNAEWLAAQATVLLTVVNVVAQLELFPFLIVLIRFSATESKFDARVGISDTFVAR